MTSAENYDELPNFINDRDEHIFCRYWTPAMTKWDTPRALVFVSHGFAEHCGWYAPIAEKLAENGVLVFAHDHVGHGRSEGTKAFITDYRYYIDDVIQHVKIVKKKYQEAPIFIVGHSMGGAISVMAVQREEKLFKGIALIAPLIIPSPESATSLKVLAAKVLAWVWPGCPVGKLNPDYICRDQNVVQNYKDDPYNYHGAILAGWGVAGLNALNELQSNLHKVTCPLLVIHGNEDKLCELSGSEMLHMLATSSDKTLSIYENAYHQVHYEPDGQGEKCRNELVEWILSRI